MPSAAAPPRGRCRPSGRARRASGRSGRAPRGCSSDPAPPPRPGRSRRPGAGATPDLGGRRRLELGEAGGLDAACSRIPTMRSTSASPPSTLGVKPASATIPSRWRILPRERDRRARLPRQARGRGAHGGASRAAGRAGWHAARSARRTCSRALVPSACTTASRIQMPPVSRTPASSRATAVATLGGMPNKTGSMA